MLCCRLETAWARGVTEVEMNAGVEVEALWLAAATPPATDAPQCHGHVVAGHSS